MAIAENQLETWSAQGPTNQFTDAYNSIRGHLLAAGAPYPLADTEKSFSRALTGMTRTFTATATSTSCSSTPAFSTTTSAGFRRNTKSFKSDSRRMRIRLPQFKAEAEGYIKRLYNGVQVGKKAVYVPGNTAAASADVLIARSSAAILRTSPAPRCHKGVAFFRAARRIENFPKQHSDNCTTKHKQRISNFKPMVRVFKNMRNTMIEKGLLAEGVAPSYFIEGMLYNVPNEKFTGSLSRYVGQLLQLDRHDRRDEADMRQRVALAREGRHADIMARREL